MNTSVKPSSVAVNYTKEQEKIISDSAPMNWEKAQVLAEQFGKTAQSVVSKCKSMDVEYICKPAPVKKAKETTKVELVARIAKMVDRDCDGLEKATRSVLLKLENGIKHLMPTPVEVAPPELGDSNS